MSLDLKDFFLATPMKKAKYMKLRFNIIPSDIVQRYNLQDKCTTDGYIFVKIKKGMYGLKEAAVLAYDQLTEFLNKEGYHHVQGTSGL